LAKRQAKQDSEASQDAVFLILGNTKHKYKEPTKVWVKYVQSCVMIMQIAHGL
jgi:hypothetical protein